MQIVEKLFRSLKADYNNNGTQISYGYLEMDPFRSIFYFQDAPHSWLFPQRYINHRCCNYLKSLFYSVTFIIKLGSTIYTLLAHTHTIHLLVIV